MLQKKGREIIPFILEKILTGQKIRELIDEYNYKDLPRDVYFGIHDLGYLQQNGYAHVFDPILVDNGPIILEGTIDGIVIQLQESRRWEKKYGSAAHQFDLILAIPKWSRVVTLSTSEISPTELVTKIRQFDKLSLEGYHLYEFFNKLHGVTGRKVVINEQKDEEIISNLSDLVFLLRTIEDIKKIAKCRNMKLFTIVPDINGRPRIACSFAVTCKILDIHDVMVEDGTGIDPYTFKLVCSDSSSTIDMRLNSHIFNASNVLNKRFHNACFGHPEQLKEVDSTFLIIGNWFLGDNMPNVTIIIPLSPKLNYTKYEILGFLNTRKKVSVKLLQDRWQGKPVSFSNWGHNIRIDGKGQNCYYKEKQWDENVFWAFIASGLKNPSLSEIMKLDIPYHDLDEWREDTSTYFKINDYMKMLYSSDDPIAKLESVYQELLPRKLLNQETKDAENGDQEEEVTPALKEIPLLHEVNDWTVIRTYAAKLEKSKFSADDVFGWGNGGKIMAKKWRKARISEQANWAETISKKGRKARVNALPADELLSALAYISQGRGSVFLPEFFKFT